MVENGRFPEIEIEKALKNEQTNFLDEIKSQGKKWFEIIPKQKTWILMNKKLIYLTQMIRTRVLSSLFFRNGKCKGAKKRERNTQLYQEIISILAENGIRKGRNVLKSNVRNSLILLCMWLY